MSLHRLSLSVHPQSFSYLGCQAFSLSLMDPSWMSPLIKYLLKIKAKVTSTHKDRLKLINERISKAIMDNRVRLNSSCGTIGSSEWWKKTNTICSYKTPSRCTLSETEIEDLNCFFGHFLLIRGDNGFSERALLVTGSA